MQCFRQANASAQNLWVWFPGVTLSPCYDFPRLQFPRVTVSIELWFHWDMISVLWSWTFAYFYTERFADHKFDLQGMSGDIVYVLKLCKTTSANPLSLTEKAISKTRQFNIGIWKKEHTSIAMYLHFSAEQLRVNGYHGSSSPHQQEDVDEVDGVIGGRGVPWVAMEEAKRRRARNVVDLYWACQIICLAINHLVFVVLWPLTPTWAAPMSYANLSWGMWVSFVTIDPCNSSINSSATLFQGMGVSFVTLYHMWLVSCTTLYLVSSDFYH